MVRREVELEEQISLEDNYDEIKPTDTIRGSGMYVKALEELVNHMPVIAFVRRVGEDGMVEFISDNISEFGYRAEDFYSGKLAYDDMIDSEDAAVVLLELQENAREGAFDFVQTYRIRTGNGQVKWVQEKTFIFRNDEGRPVYYTGTLKEIKEQ